MRFLAIVLTTIGLAACSAAPETRADFQAVGSTQVLAPELEKVVEFLVTSAATDLQLITRQTLRAFVMCALATS
jgi:type IV pilus biogenesis protein CpaD/CtpE